MPIVQVNMLEGRSVDAKRDMIAAVTEAITQSLQVPAASVRILINEMQPEHYAVAGVSAGEQPLAARRQQQKTTADNGVALTQNA